MADDAFDAWFTGLVDGEGCFLTNLVAGKHVIPIFDVTLRADDVAILSQCQARFGGAIYRAGRIPYTHNGKLVIGNPCAHWKVTKRDHLRELVLQFDKYPLRTKKARDYAIWRNMVLEYSVPYKKRDLSFMAASRQALKMIRRFEPAAAT